MSTRRRWRVTIRGRRIRTFGEYADGAEAHRIAERLRKHGFEAKAEPVEDGQAPEHNSDRRRFLTWCVMLGVVPPERMTERVVAELEHEAS